MGMPENGKHEFWVIKILETLPDPMIPGLGGKGLVQIHAEGADTFEEAEEIAEGFRTDRTYGKKQVCHAIITRSADGTEIPGHLHKKQIDVLSSFLAGHWKEISESEHREAFEQILKALNPNTLKAIKRLRGEQKME